MNRELLTPTADLSLDPDAVCCLTEYARLEPVLVIAREPFVRRHDVCLESLQLFKNPETCRVAAMVGVTNRNKTSPVRGLLRDFCGSRSILEGCSSRKSRRKVQERLA